LTFEAAATALGPIAGFAQKLLGTHVNVAAFRAEDEFLKTRFLLVSRGHG